MHTDDNRSHEPGQQPAVARAAMDFSSPYAPIDASEVHSVRPLGLTVISVLCILGGIVGLLVGLLGIAQIFLAETIANLANVGAPSGNMADAQREMQEKTQAVANQFFIPNLVALIAKVSVAICLLIGGIGLIRNKLSSIKLLRQTFIVGIVLEVASMVLQGLVQWRIAPIMQEFFGNMMSNADGKEGGAPGSEVMSQMMGVGMILGMVFVVVWAIIKIGIMIWSRSYLGRPSTREYLSPQSTVTH